MNQSHVSLECLARRKRSQALLTLNVRRELNRFLIARVGKSVMVVLKGLPVLIGDDHWNKIG